MIRENADVILSGGKRWKRERTEHVMLMRDERSIKQTGHHDDDGAKGQAKAEIFLGCTVQGRLPGTVLQFADAEGNLCAAASHLLEYSARVKFAALARGAGAALIPRHDGSF